MGALVCNSQLAASRTLLHLLVDAPALRAGGWVWILRERAAVADGTVAVLGAGNEQLTESGWLARHAPGFHTAPALLSIPHAAPLNNALRYS